MNKKNISLSTELYDILINRINNSNDEFKSIDDYVEYVLRQLFNDDFSKTYTEEEEKEIEKHLKDMGYI